MGTLSGPMVGTAAFRLMEFYLHKWFGESASFILGGVYVALVLFVPYGIVGTWQQRSRRVKEGWQWLLKLATGGGGET